jgi:bacterial/archaeal transporter family-2 protein
MIEIVATLLIGLVGGIAVGTQGAIVGEMSRRVGGSAGSFIVHASGAALAGVMLIMRGGEQIQNWRSLSWYMLGSGALGVLLYLTLNHTLPRLGATSALALVVVGQMIMGLAIDHFGMFGVAVRPIDGARLCAALLLVAGGYLALR